MNFLGHIYFSGSDPELMHANLFGDFVKGSDLSAFHPEVQKGIRLHRKIDHYIDNHPEVKLLTRQLAPSLPKVAGIAVDIYFDHFLSKHWSRYHSESLDSFLEKFYTYHIDEKEYPNEQFLHMIFRLKRGRWISGYSDLDGVEAACFGVSRRISFPNALINGRMVLENNYTAVEEAFFVYMNDAIDYFAKNAM